MRFTRSFCPVVESKRRFRSGNSRVVLDIRGRSFRLQELEKLLNQRGRNGPTNRYSADHRLSPTRKGWCPLSSQKFVSIDTHYLKRLKETAKRLQEAFMPLDFEEQFKLEQDLFSSIPRSIQPIQRLVELDE